MADFAYNIACKEILDGDMDFNAPSDFQVILLEAGSDLNKNDADIAAVLVRAGTDELTSTNYARTALANETTAQDDANDRAEADADDITFSGLVQAAAETISFFLVYLEVGADAADQPIFQMAISPAVVPNGDFTISWNAEGFLQLASA